VAGQSTQHTLDITLEEIQPPVWRRVRIASSATLADLHEVLQIVMGWSDAHLHEFAIGGEMYGVLDEESDDDIQDESTTTVGAVAPVRSIFGYVYDFGDWWQHTITVASISPSDGMGPVCLAGERACPPEDCGCAGRAYDDLLEAVRDPMHPRHREAVEIVGDRFDPEHFDIESVNRSLSALRHG
jgi:hypothetical protein